MKDSLKEPTISIVIPVKNGISTIQQCLDAIFKQTLIEQAEVIIIDSGSTDGTLDALRKYPVRLYTIPSEEFNHGETRNYGVSLALGEIVVMTVQDAVASDNLWLYHITEPFKDDKVMGVCGRQVVPHNENMNPGAWFETFSEPQKQKARYSMEELNNMSPVEKKTKLGWDNVSAAYRKSALKNTPFIKTNYSEDIHWAYQMYKTFHTLVYAPMAMVQHYHHESFNYRTKRHFIEITQLFYIYNLKTIPTISKQQLIAFYLLKKNSKFTLYWLSYNIKILMANLLSEFRFTLTLFFTGTAGLEKLYRRITKEIPIGRTNSK